MQRVVARQKSQSQPDNCANYAALLHTMFRSSETKHKYPGSEYQVLR